MGGKILTIFQIQISVIIFLLISSLITTDIQTSNAKDYTQDFSETVRYKGYITKDMYEDFLKSMPFSSKISLIHEKKDEFSKDDILDLTFTKDIVDEIFTNGIYKLKVGDDFKIIVKKASPTYFETIVSIFTNKEPKKYKPISVKGGMVLNEQYH